MIYKTSCKYKGDKIGINLYLFGLIYIHSLINNTQPLHVSPIPVVNEVLNNVLIQSA